MQRLSSGRLSLVELHDELRVSDCLELCEFLKLRDCFLRAEWAKVTGFEEGLAFVRVHLGDLLLQSQTFFPQQATVAKFVVTRLLRAVKFLQSQVSDRRVWPTIERLQAGWLSMRLASDALSQFNCRFDFLLEREFELAVADWIISDAKICENVQIDAVTDTIIRRILNSPSSEGLVAKVVQLAVAKLSTPMHHLVVSKLSSATNVPLMPVNPTQEHTPVNLTQEPISSDSLTHKLTSVNPTQEHTPVNPTQESISDNLAQNLTSVSPAQEHTPVNSTQEFMSDNLAQNLTTADPEQEHAPVNPTQELLSNTIAHEPLPNSEEQTK
jgi:hypothetical protein